jgi:hypothetical protein
MFPCNVERDTQSETPKEENDEVFTGTLSQPILEAQDPRYNAKRSQQIAVSVLDLSQRLIENILSQRQKKFEIVSPISIASALQLALLGSSGMTFSELMDV